MDYIKLFEEWGGKKFYFYEKNRTIPFSSGDSEKAIKTHFDTYGKDIYFTASAYSGKKFNSLEEYQNFIKIPQKGK